MVKLLTYLGLTTYIVSTYAAVYTTFHVNEGCILVDNKPLCAGNTQKIYGGRATVYARYDGNNKNAKSYPGCKVLFKWPSNGNLVYGDVYYGSDNCLYDSNGDNFNGQCCDEQPKLSQTINPYR